MSHNSNEEQTLKENKNRREFLKKSTLGIAAALIGAKFVSRPSTAQAETKLVMAKETDPMSKALGYYEDASKVDTKKWTKRAGASGAKQFCYNCQFYQSTAGNPKDSKAAPCTILAGKGVAAMGWCNSWTQNPKVKG